MSRSLACTRDVATLLRSKNALWINTREEARVEGYLFEAGASAKYVTLFWDAAQGITNIAGETLQWGSPDPGEILNTIATRAKQGNERTLFILRDFAPWLTGPIGTITCRQLRNLIKILPSIPTSRAQSLIILSAAGEIPPELSDHLVTFDWPLPDRDEIAEILDSCINILSEDIKSSAAPNGARDAAIDAAVGLSGTEASACYSRSLVQLRKIDPQLVVQEKKRIIEREKVLEWCEPLPNGLDAVGGLDVLKQWCLSRRAAYTPAARAYGLPAPRGVLLVGMSGCGKSLMAKAIATIFGFPLLRFDLGALKDKFVGTSEANFRKAKRVVEAMGRCIIWIDEIEKALAGATQGAADGGVSADALGALLTWMQERTSECFFVATSNDVSALPPELLRKGRFDELFFVDLPNLSERREILHATLRQYGRNPNAIYVDDDEDLFLDQTSNFTGAEIAALIPEALFVAFADAQREITMLDIIRATESIVPLAKTAAEKIEKLREWQRKGGARSATTPQTRMQSTVTSQFRNLDL